MRPAAALIAALAVLVMVLAGCSTSAPARPESVTVRVAAASDLKFALDELAGVLAEQHPDVDLVVTYGSSGTFVQQISSGAPFDLYLSADLGYARQLVEAGLAREEDLFPYAVGRLALWVPAGSPLDPAAGLAGLADPAVGPVAIANPAHAPYGRAAVAALQAADVHGAVEDRLVLGENVAQAVEFVQSGNADAGVVALSLVVAGPLEDVGRWQEIPLESYPRIEQGGVVLSSARDPDAARAVRDSLLSAQGRAVLERHGFRMPES